MNLCYLQICVPASFTDEEATEFANSAMPSGIRSKWQMVEDGDEALDGYPQRNPCDNREGCVHILLEC